MPQGLNYQRRSVGGRFCVPTSWCTVKETSAVGSSIADFDRLADRLMSLEVFAEGRMPLEESAVGDHSFTTGPMSGPVTEVERIDESLVQGLVLGTALGNSHCGELRIELELDEDSETVTGTAEMSWQCAAHLLPGAQRRESSRRRRALQRLLDAVRG